MSPQVRGDNIAATCHPLVMSIVTDHVIVTIIVGVASTFLRTVSKHLSNSLRISFAVSVLLLSTQTEQRQSSLRNRTQTACSGRPTDP